MKIYIAYIPDIENRPDLPDKYINLLSADETKRFKSMTDDTRRLQFLIGRSLIYDVYHQSPTILPTGKPVVENGYISLAHSGPYVVLATSETPVGVDIEDASQNKDFIRLARRLNFQLTRNERLSFYQQFTRYESTYKISVPSQPLYHRYYSIDTFILCATTLNKKEKIEFIKTIPLLQKASFPLACLEPETL